MSSSVKIAIPESGRITEDMLQLLADLGIANRDWAKNAVYAISTVKKKGREEEVRAILASKWKDGIEGLTMKYDLRSGWRLTFSATKAEVAGVPVVIYGSESPTISGIRQGLADSAIIGLDNLFAEMVPYFARGRPKTWEDLNKAIWPENSTDVRVIGSTGMEDYCGLCLLMPANYSNIILKLTELYEGQLPVYVKGKNQGLAYYLLGRNIDARPTETIEDAIVADKCFGLDIVRTGVTAAKKELYVLPPLLFTFSVVAIDIAKYESNEDFRAVVQSMKPRTNSQEDYIIGRQKWEKSLQKTLCKLMR